MDEMWRDETRLDGDLLVKVMVCSLDFFFFLAPHTLVCTEKFMLLNYGVGEDS